MSASIPVYNPQSLPDWNEAVEQWIIYLAAWGRRPSTITHYGDELRRFSAWARVRGITPYSTSRIHIDDYVIDLRSERNLGGRSIAARLTAIRQFFKWMNVREFRIDDPTLAIQSPKFQNPLPKPLPFRLGSRGSRTGTSIPLTTVMDSSLPATAKDRPEPCFRCLTAG